MNFLIVIPHLAPSHDAGSIEVLTDSMEMVNYSLDPGSWRAALPVRDDKLD